MDLRNQSCKMKNALQRSDSGRAVVRQWSGRSQAEVGLRSGNGRPKLRKCSASGYAEVGLRL